LSIAWFAVVNVRSNLIMVSYEYRSHSLLWLWEARVCQVEIPALF